MGPQGSSPLQLPSPLAYPCLLGPSLTGTSPKVATSLTDSGKGLAYRRYPMMGR